MVSAKLLPQPLDVRFKYFREGESEPPLASNAQECTVSVVYVRELDTKEELSEYLECNPASRDYDTGPLISGLNLILQQHASRTGVRVGKNRYFFKSTDPRDKITLSTHIEAWLGFYVSVRPVYKQLMVNVNVCMTAFYKPCNLATAMLQFGNKSKGAMAKTLPQRLRVTMRYRGYKMRKNVYEIKSTSANQTFFHHEKYGRISVKNYIEKEYNITLEHPDDVPVVDIGNEKKSIYVPAELCEIEDGEPYRGQLNTMETQNMIRYACKRPADNARIIVNQGLQTLALTQDKINDPMSSFGISVSDQMAVIPARELPPPKVYYKSGKPPNVTGGSWNILEVTFQKGSVVKSWSVLVVRDGFSNWNENEVRRIWMGFRDKCRKSGMTMPDQPKVLFTNPLVPEFKDAARATALDQVRQTINENVEPGDQSFILVLLQKHDHHIYPGIKRICDVELGIHTIHMLLTQKVFGPGGRLDQYFSNVALKLNTKLGGANHRLDPDSMKWLTQEKTMVVGMDVTHPGPASRKGTPSIAAVVASVDDSFVQFPASMRIQEGRKEASNMITDLAEMMEERLKLWQEKNRILPARVYVFRDGVSEGQFDSVLTKELPLILDSFRGMSNSSKKYRPKLTIVICGKRHHARFFPIESNSADKNGNTRPGTVVDKGVTTVFDYDFYLQAHAGLQGTAKPTHYTVIYDENALDADNIQQGTHTTSYLYARATKAVSLVPAAYYADLACERGRYYINDFLNAGPNKLSESEAGGGKGKGKGKKKGKEKGNDNAGKEEKERVFNAAKEMWGAGVHAKLKDSMFYI
ncbi:hypothetical protein SERLA73DRAFT_92911 [Serpula lacrymans var. lacrymans S7.3]|uniref:Piwi domain-containing protein n=1 Tax=Serpula lacrymans var. lacrymans (strain S7.3) TaxID=936435 RepID=F8Q3E1_SERL3|nr:hypothetical protein SERLA73DRAFT_92911 [Serpula lacrymans var. lacrymans S7.3]